MYSFLVLTVAKYLIYSSISDPPLIPISLLLRYTPRSWSTEYINWSPLSYIELLVTLGLYYLLIILDSVPGSILFQNTFLETIEFLFHVSCFRSLQEYDNDKTDFLSLFSYPLQICTKTLFYWILF